MLQQTTSAQGWCHTGKEAPCILVSYPASATLRPLNRKHECFTLFETPLTDARFVVERPGPVVET